MNPEQMAETIVGDLMSIFDDGALPPSYVIDVLKRVRRLLKIRESNLRGISAAELVRDTIPAPPPVEEEGQ